MTAVLTSTSPSAVASAIEQNPIEYWRTWIAHCPGASWEETPEFTRFLTGAPYEPCNQIITCNLPDQRLEARVAELMAPFRERSVPMLWSLSPSVKPQNLDGSLERAGLVAQSEQLVGMAIDLGALPRTHVPGLRVDRVSEEAMLDVWGRTYHNGFGLPEGFAQTFVATFQRAGLNATSPFRHYVGYLEGEPVACSTMFLGAGVAGMWHIATLPPARRRGIGSALTVAPLLDARELGYRIGSLYAAPMSAPVYRRLGFQDYFTVRQFGWSPQTTAS